MDDSFFRSHWNSPFYPTQRRPSAWGIPVHDVRTAASPRVVAVHPKQGIQSAEPSKVVKIPVQFVDTDRRRSESESAVRIQKVFRGFMVRKSVKKIADVRREVDEIESRISRTEVIDLMRRDSRERLGVSEMLMSLLFRLDSVRGLDPGVRNCRKTAIRKVIALQEALDAIVAADGSSAAETTGEEAIEITEAVEVPVDERKPADSCPVTQIELQNPDLVGGESGSAEVVTETDDIEVPKIQTESAPDKSPEITHENERSEAKGEGPEEIERTESQTDSSANPEIPEEKNEENQRRARTRRFWRG
ncbi:PREDICTED: uncharacterized protein LOC104825581 [Tarenaya hassleriana]|uniref:uncharacterized protein LOC104825581 n=1 Tax=Tarenaya hassleriana TaxID=28532 RepID=UPI00053C523C|nr:PREDICTED: uncharacterized protein LOC104825581 [Tarenaya hassleriana]